MRKENQTREEARTWDETWPTDHGAKAQESAIERTRRSDQVRYDGLVEVLPRRKKE